MDFRRQRGITMSKSIKRRFTEWYVKQGYKFGYEFAGVPVIDEDLFSILSQMMEPYWTCPFWVRPLLIFFSPSIYFMEITGKNFVKYFNKGLEEGIRQLKEVKKKAGIDI